MGISVWPNGSAALSQHSLLHLDGMAPMEGLPGPVCNQTSMSKIQVSVAKHTFYNKAEN
jgi:hypothetical protein